MAAMRALAIALLLCLAGCPKAVDPDGPEAFTANCKARGCRPVMYGTTPGCDCTPDAGPLRISVWLVPCLWLVSSACARASAP